MKFIPVPAFERINSLVQAVEAQGCLLTMRLEAYTCRQTREEKSLAVTISNSKRQHSSAIGGGGVVGTSSHSPNGSSNAAQVSPILQPAVGGYVHGHFPDVLMLPSVIGASTDPCSSNGDGMMGAPQGSYDSGEAVGVDERLVYLVAALNAIHGDGYDFSVLEESDFDLLDAAYARSEIENMLSSLSTHPSCASVVGMAPYHEPFWHAIADVVVGGNHAGGGGQQPSTYPNPSSPVDSLFSSCEFFLFRCPDCDPIAQRTIWSNHVFIYSKRNRVMVSLLAYGEGNMYRGDDGIMPASGTGAAVTSGLPNSESHGDYYFDGEQVHSWQDDETSQHTTDSERDVVVSTTSGAQKNRGFYGY